MEKTVTVKINGKDYTVPSHYTILEAARHVGIDIPTLCYLKGINEIGACRMCVVEVKGARSLVAACVYPIADVRGEILTHSKKVIESRKLTLELILSNHDMKCLSCDRSKNCELQTLCKEYGVDNPEAYAGSKTQTELDCSTPHLVRDNAKCILCRRCVGACHNQFVSVIGANDRGFDTTIGSAFNAKLNDVACVACGQCIVACPTGALREKDDTDKVIDALNDPTKHVVVSTAPAVRATLGECFGEAPGTLVTGKLTAALRRLGFDAVFDTDFGADLTIMEEGTEFIDRVKNGGVLPMITSCSPGWINFVEHYYPEFIPNLSTCKSPQQMQGAITKTWYAERNGIDPESIYHVSVMPCVAKKGECQREEMRGSGYADVDTVITTRELARLMERCGINWELLPEEDFDPILGESSGAAPIFGVTGGVMEAALRTVSEVLEGKELGNVEFHDVRGLEGIKEATIKVAGMDVKVAISSGLKNVAKLLDDIKAGKREYHFIEVMCCPGGCINGGGQPIQPAVVRNNVDLRKLRADALYREDAGKAVRKSHESPAIKLCYEEFLGEPNSHKAHELLHTHYTKKNRY